MIKGNNYVVNFEGKCICSIFKFHGHNIEVIAVKGDVKFESVDL